VVRLKAKKLLLKINQGGQASNWNKLSMHWSRHQNIAPVEQQMAEGGEEEHFYSLETVS
jgi:hypothetical protein